jgi:hypothetical protein
LVRGWRDTAEATAAAAVGSVVKINQQAGPLDVQVLFLFGSGLAPAPGRARTKRASPVMAGAWRNLRRAGVGLGCVVAAEPGVRDKTQALLPKRRQRHGLRGRQPPLHPPFTVRRRPHSSPLRVCRRPKHSQRPLQLHALPAAWAFAEPVAVVVSSASHYIIVATR